VPLIHAAALPLAGLTAEQALNRAKLAPGETALIVGAAGAVGGFALQLAHHRGATVIGLGRSADQATMTALGATTVLSSDDPVPPDVTDVVVDTAGAPIMIRAVRDGGRYVSIVPTAVPQAERGIEVLVSFVEQDGEALSRLSDLVDRGLLELRIASSYPFEKAAQAHRALAEGGVRGKILLIPPPMQRHHATSVAE
jgi:NADPH:quinone reductase-like Zn-dependent oxidoreductase